MIRRKNVTRSPDLDETLDQLAAWIGARLILGMGRVESGYLRFPAPAVVAAFRTQERTEAYLFERGLIQPTDESRVV